MCLFGTAKTPANEYKKGERCIERITFEKGVPEILGLAGKYALDTREVKKAMTVII
jgi:hypothetical protein